jgi:hypothetical protein
VRDIKESDSAYLLVAPLPDGARSIEAVKQEFILSVLFDPQGKYGAYGAVDDRKVTSWNIESVSLPSGGQQVYRRAAVSFSPLTYNANLVERKALISATAVGGSVFLFVSGSMANRFKKIKPELINCQESFRAVGSRGVRGGAVVVVGG